MSDRRPVVAGDHAGRRDSDLARNLEPDDLVVEDFRDADTRRADAQLVGLWYRCPVHGLTQDPILLGYVPYCPADPCTEALLLVHHAQAATKSEWTRSPTFEPRQRRAPREAPPIPASNPPPIPPQEEQTVSRPRDYQGPLLKSVILEVLDDGEPHERVEIIDRVEEATGRGKSTSAILSQLKARGLVRSPRKGVWQLAASEDQDDVDAETAESAHRAWAVVIDDDEDAGDEGPETPGLAPGLPEDAVPAAPEHAPPEAAPALSIAEKLALPEPPDAPSVAAVAGGLSVRLELDDQVVVELRVANRTTTTFQLVEALLAAALDANREGSPDGRA